MPGVRITDHGAKMGLNGVDNGRIWFDHVCVPRWHMLDALASVDEAGTYSSKIPSIAQRFGAMVGGLTTGRVLIAQAAVDACKQGVTIAIRYSASRTQFNDKPIISYITQQRPLFIGLATTYAMALGQLRLKVCGFMVYRVDCSLHLLRCRRWCLPRATPRRSTSSPVGSKQPPPGTG